jgi:general stress protein YciG
MTANGGFHFIGTFTGTLEFVPDDPAKPSFTGRATIWFGDNDNLRIEADTVTFTVHADGSDGSSLDVHDTMHFSVSATGLEVSFDKLRCGLGKREESDEWKSATARDCSVPSPTMPLGRISRGGGFAANRELAVEAGRKGGKAPRRPRNMDAYFAQRFVVDPEDYK